jgi:FAD/FMN-containing dehydrogenase
MRVAPFRDLSGVPMCDKCVELDGKIEHYHRLSSTITDQATLDGIKQLVERMKAQKAALHPEQEQ